MEHAILKGLQVTLREYEQQLQDLKKRQKELSQDVERKARQVESAKARIRELTRKTIVVSEHALLRYIERVYNLDLKAVARHVLPEEVEKQVRVLGDGVYPVSETHKVRIQGGTVVTVMPLE